MDGFDDLLAPSRDVLENPFEDPFVKHRSNSPDPWASFGQPAGAGAGEDSAAAAFHGVRSATPTFELAHGNDEHGGFSDCRLPDPLDSVAHAADEETPSSPTGPTSATSPGFRESISIVEEQESKAEEVKSARTPSPITESSKSLTPPPSSLVISSDVSRKSVHLSRESTTSLPSSHLQTTRVERAFQTPLDQPPPSGHERSIAGLAIGGESIGGWQGTQSTDSDDDEDDDRPILQTAKLSERMAATSISSTPAPRTENGLQPVFVVTVDDPQRVGDPIRAHTMYTVHTKTTSPLFKKSSFAVLRRYSDFLWLYETLSLNNPGVVVPPVPEKNPFGRFDNDFVQQRRLALEKCIQKITSHPVLQKDPDLKMFLESDTFALDIKHRKAEIAQEKGGLMASIGQSITGPRFYETDEWFDRQKAYLDSLESQLRGLVKAIDLVAKHRAELAAATGEFAQTIADLGASDLGKQLSASLSGLTDVEHKAQELQNIQAQEDVITVMSTADEYARLINSVRLSFNSRVRMYYAWQNADANLKRTKQMHETNRAQGRLPSDQLSRSLALVAETERRALDAKQEFEQVSRLVKSEVARFEQERIEDFKNSLEAFLEGMISRQKQLISAWENYQVTLLKRVTPQNVNQRQHESPVTMAG
ncbi:Sorting nexin-1 [Grifola frondosa]|uniref:Sorting nexin-1 n=1 Tax=Grifola frondosa TaxID=5627 RepID=A0A1C7M9G5_GRIFR|nr:Sorting nexin-1 [Grifola frondosa]